MTDSRDRNCSIDMDWCRERNRVGRHASPWTRQHPKSDPRTVRIRFLERLSSHTLARMFHPFRSSNG